MTDLITRTPLSVLAEDLASVMAVTWKGGK